MPRCPAVVERALTPSPTMQKVNRMSKRHPNIHNEILMEKAVLSRLRHPHVARLYFTFQDHACLFFLSE